MFLQQIIFSFSVGTWVKFIGQANERGTAFQYRCHKQMNEAHIHTSSLDIGHTMAHNGSRVGTKLISNQFRAGIGILRARYLLSIYKASIHDIRLMSLQICVKSKHGCSSGMMTRSQDLVNLRACNARSSLHNSSRLPNLGQSSNFIKNRANTLKTHISVILTHLGYFGYLQ